jgi:hypothetical protein
MKGMRLPNWLRRERHLLLPKRDDASKHKVIAFWREEGAICYALTLPTQQAAEAFSSLLPEQLLSSGLAWCWQSWRNAPLADDSPVRYLPEQRLLTRLTADNAQELVDEFQERDVDGYGRFITLIGCDIDAAAELLNVRQMQMALKTFANAEAPPVRIVLNQLNDDVAVHLFVPHRPVEAVQRLLWVWEVPTWVCEVRPYAHLYQARLEALRLVSEGGRVLVVGEK